LWRVTALPTSAGTLFALWVLGGFTSLALAGLECLFQFRQAGL
jgi:hypothetical protein